MGNFHPQNKTFTFGEFLFLQMAENQRNAIWAEIYFCATPFRLSFNRFFSVSFIASERLFLDNPTMDGTSSADTGLRGDGQERNDLVGDHVSVLPVILRRATWSPTNMCYA